MSREIIQYKLLNKSISSSSDEFKMLSSNSSSQVQLQNNDDLVNVESDIGAVEMRHKQHKKNVFYENTTTIVHILVLQFVVFILYLSFSDKVELFTWHPILFAIGWALLMTEAIMALSGDNALTKFITPKNRIFTHWIMMTLAAILITAGFIIVIINKNINNKQHFKTNHAIVGLAAIVLAGVCCVIGIPTLFKLELRTIIRPVILKSLHIFFGVSAFILGTATLILSLYTNWFVKRTGYSAQVMCFVIIIVTSVWVMIKPTRFLLNRVMNW